MQPIVSESWPHPKLDAHIKPQPTNEKCWRQADRRIKSDQPIRESRVFRAQTARQLANQTISRVFRAQIARQLDLTIRQKAPPRKSSSLRQTPPVSASLRQTPPDSARFSQTPPGMRAVTVIRRATSPDSAAALLG